MAVMLRDLSIEEIKKVHEFALDEVPLSDSARQALDRLINEIIEFKEGAAHA